MWYTGMKVVFRRRLILAPWGLKPRNRSHIPYLCVPQNLVGLPWSSSIGCYCFLSKVMFPRNAGIHQCIRSLLSAELLQTHCAFSSLHARLFFSNWHAQFLAVREESYLHVIIANGWQHGRRTITESCNIAKTFNVPNPVSFFDTKVWKW